MPHTTSRFVRRAAAFLAVATLGCGSELLMPEPADGGNDVVLSKLTGDQTGTVGEPLGDPLVVQVMTPRENPVEGRKVAFLVDAGSAGQVSPDTAVTDAEGKATARWTLGTVPGEYLVTARLVDSDVAPQVAEFHAAVNPGAPDALSAASDQSQPGRRKQQVPAAPVVLVADRFGNPVPNASVVWQVAAGEGTVSEPVTVTDANGTATTQWILGDRIGLQRLTAAVEGISGSTVTFSATVLF
jgi:Bacterial Ig-like domain (group 1)